MLRYPAIPVCDKVARTAPPPPPPSILFSHTQNIHPATKRGETLTERLSTSLVVQKVVEHVFITKKFERIFDTLWKKMYFVTNCALVKCPPHHNIVPIDKLICITTYGKKNVVLLLSSSSFPEGVRKEKRATSFV